LEGLTTVSMFGVKKSSLSTYEPHAVSVLVQAWQSRPRR
jgi:hypothetical protein